jgi:trigger factor
MKTSVEDISSVKKKLLIEIESLEVNNRLNEAFEELGKRAEIPGFRRGKVPRKILERHFGNQVVDDVARDLINKTLPQAVEEAGTFPIGTPLLEKETLKQGQDFRYSAVMEVRPKFKLGKYLGLEVKKEKCFVTEEDVQNQLDQIRASRGSLKTIDQERPVQNGDYVVLDYEAFEGKRPLDGIKASNFLLKVGSNNFHPKFEESLIGLSKESRSEFNVDFERDYYHSKLAGRNVKFKVRLVSIKEMVLPVLDDEFAKNIDSEIKDLEDLRKKIREAVINREEKRIERELRQRLLQNISDSVDFDLPQVLVESEIMYAIENVRQNMLRSGSSLEKAGLSEEKLWEDFRPVAEKRVKEMLILGEIAKENNISVEEEDLQKGFEDLAATTGQPAKTIREYYEARNLVDSLREKLIEEKTLKYLVECANICEVDRSELVRNMSNKENK